MPLALASDLELIVLRHGQTAWNIEKRCQGWLDSPLTARGKDQAAAMGRTLKQRLGAEARDFHFTISPLGRVRETTALIRDHVDTQEPAIDARLCEIGLGSWEGLNRDEVAAMVPAVLEPERARNWYLLCPDGEGVEVAQARLGGWLQEMHGRVIVVSHGLSGSIVRGLYLGLGRKAMLDLPYTQDGMWHLKDGRETLWSTLSHQAEVSTPLPRAPKHEGPGI